MVLIIIINFTIKGYNMPNFQFKKKSNLSERLNKSVVQVHIGDRPSSKRPIQQFAAVVLIAGSAMIAAPAHANWFSRAYSSQQIQPQEVNQAQTMSIGVIRQIMPATVENQGMNGGNMIGGVAGAVVGHQFGHGTGNLLATLGGALLGGKIGGNIERSHTKTNAYQVVVHIVDGHGGPYQTDQDILVVQPKDAPVALNELVYITGTYGNAPRIIPIPTNVVNSNVNSNMNSNVSEQSQSVNQQFHSSSPTFQQTSSPRLGVTYSSTPPRFPR